MRVRVFRNLTRRAYSVQAHLGPGWRTVAWAEHVALAAARFHVSQSGRSVMLRLGTRLVHAWAEGELLSWNGQVRIPDVLPPPARPATLPQGDAATYRPWTDDRFRLTESGQPIDAAAAAVFSTAEGLRVVGAR